jgi:hypothetical protein
MRPGIAAFANLRCQRAMPRMGAGSDAHIATAGEGGDKGIGPMAVNGRLARELAAQGSIGIN